MKFIIQRQLSDGSWEDLDEKNNKCAATAAARQTANHRRLHLNDAAKIRVWCVDLKVVAWEG